MIPVFLAGTGSALPRRSLTTRELVERAFPGGDPASLRAIEEKTGIDVRYWLSDGESAATLAAEALGRALDRARLPAGALGRIILVTSTGGDHLVPATAHDVAGLLGLSDSCDAFDMSNSCVGFLSAFDVAARSVATGSGPVAIVAVETFSRHLSPEGPRAYVVLGDAAAAAVLVPVSAGGGGGGGGGGGIVAGHLRSSERLRGKMTMALPGTPGARPYHDFDVRSRELTDSAHESIKASIDHVLSAAALSLGQIDWVLIHQPNGAFFHALVARLGVDPARTVPVVRDVGSVGAASVPTSLDRLMRTRAVAPGQRILLASVGAGTAHGALLYQVGR
jgi:3-oxoacyl-[acyl-carrier-protein] synthase-3